MGRRRGFFAELQHSARLAERQQLRAEREAERRLQAAIREAERQRKAEERARAQMLRASAAERKEREREAKLAHIASMEAEVEQRNAEIQSVEDELMSILSATLDVDDYVDLETLRVQFKAPPFPRPDLEVPTPRPQVLGPPVQPTLSMPEPPTGLFAFLSQGKHKRAVVEARQKYEKAMDRWRQHAEATEARNKEQEALHDAAEERRLEALARARELYERECADLAAAAEKRNAELDQLVSNLAYGVPEAVDEYISIVLANSVYPDCLPVRHEFSYDAANAELVLAALVPSPRDLPAVQAFKYSKSDDAVVPKEMPKKVQKDRYCSIVYQVALRSMHEVFEADRRELINSISLIVATETTDPATGNEARIPFVAVAATRDRFQSINLARVDAEATLRHLGASLSKNPLDLLGADTSGVRRA